MHWFRRIPLAMAVLATTATLASTVAASAAPSAGALRSAHGAAAGPAGPAIAQDAFLSDVSCVRATFCMAVGSFRDKRGRTAGLAERANDHAWLVLPVPAGLSGRTVSCPSSQFCMAIGGTRAAAWNGSTWSARTTLQHVMLDVSCTSRSFCMAVGGGVAGSGPVSAAWNGHRWRALATPDTGCVPFCGLAGVSCRSSLSCVAVGGNGTNSGVGFLSAGLAWNGKAWRNIGGTSQGINSGMDSVSCARVSNCTAVGQFQTDTPACDCVLAGAWNGRTWTGISPSPSIQGNPTSVSCPGPGRCLAIGGTLALSLTGTTWQSLTIRQPAGTTTLSQVSCWQPAGCMAVGLTMNTTATLPLAELWNGHTWQVRHTPVP